MLLPRAGRAFGLTSRRMRTQAGVPDAAGAKAAVRHAEIQLMSIVVFAEKMMLRRQPDSYPLAFQKA